MKQADHIIIKEITNDTESKGIIIRFSAEYENEEVELHTYLPNILVPALISDLAALLHENYINLVEEE